MKIDIICQDPERRRIVQRTPSVNGIDYLEVLDLDAPAGSPRQRTLMIWCFWPLPPSPGGLGAGNLRIDGGVRIRDIGVEWAWRASEAQQLEDDGLINTGEKNLFLSLPDTDKLLLVRTDAEGDFSAYTLNLVASPTSEKPPSGFDPLLSCMPFSFKVDCPSEFDCQPDEDCPPEENEEPVLNYLAKDYTTFRQLMMDRMAVIMPDWQERSAADLGITLVESLAHAADHLSYYQDAVGTEAYLGTARLRPSIRRHARLLDYPMHEGCNARAWVCFEVGTPSVALEKVDTATGQITRLLSKNPSGTVIPEAEWEQLLAVYKPAVFELVHDVTLRQSQNCISFYTWGDRECCLPEGATRATLLDQNPRALNLKTGDVLIFEEMVSPDTGLKADADPTHRWAVRLTSVDEDQDDLVLDAGGNPINVLRIEWGLQDALPFALCISALIDGSLVADLSVARGNVALADHGRTVSGENLPTPYGHRLYRPRLQERNLTFAAAYLPGASAPPAARSLIQDPARALPAITLGRGDETWHPQRDLLGSSRTAAEFVVEMQNDGLAALRFGDGIFGKQPSFDEDSSAFTASYRIGSGTAGNVGADSIAHIVTAAAGITSVRNPIPAAGGMARESLEEVRQYAPQAFRTQERAVTEADYAGVTGRHAEVQKAQATRRWTGSWYTMFITIDRIGGKDVDASFESRVRAHLEKYRLAGHDVEVDAPRFVPLAIVMTVCAKEGFFRSDVQQALLQVFSSTVGPNGRRGFFHPDNFTFGQPLYLSQMIATAMEVPGVRWVDIDPTLPKPNRFKRWGQVQGAEVDDGLIEAGRLEILRLDNDPSRPENGKIEFIMEGGSG